MSIVLIGTLDTKGVEFQYVRDLIAQVGMPVTVIDAGVMREPVFAPDITRQELFAAAGTSYEKLKADGDRGQAIDMAVKGAVKIVQDIWKSSKLSGIFGMGGSAGTTI